MWRETDRRRDTCRERQTEGATDRTRREIHRQTQTERRDREREKQVQTLHKNQVDS